MRGPAPGPAAEPDRTEIDRRPPLVGAVLAQAAMELRLLLRSGESLLVTLGIPVGILVFFSMVDVLPTGQRRPVDFLVPGVLAISIAGTGLVAVAIQTAFERKYGVLKRLGGTPLPRGGFLLAKGLAVGAVTAAQATLVVGLGLLWLGWEPAGGLLAAPLVVLGALTFTALGLLMAGTLRAEATLALSNATFLTLLVISGVTFEAAALPGPLAALGALLPLGALGESLRAAFDGSGAWVGPAAIVGGWGALAVLLSARWFRWEP